MAKKAAKATSESTNAKAEKSDVEKLVEIICRSQGVGSILAESIANKLIPEQQKKVLALAEQGALADVILSNLANPVRKETAEPDSQKPAE